MINAPQLLADLKRRLTLLDDDLRQRIDAVPELKISLQADPQPHDLASRLDCLAQELAACSPAALLATASP